MGLLSGIKKIAKKVWKAVPGAIKGFTTGGIPGAIVGGAGSIFGGTAKSIADAAGGYFAGKSSSDAIRAQNEANSAQALRQMEFQKDQAQNQMDFQERMSSSAHQREVMDLQKAGLNPILSAGGSGASSPGGAMGTGAQAHMADTKTAAIATALAVMRNRAEVKNIQANTRLTSAKASKEQAGVPVAETWEAILQQFADFVEGLLPRATTGKDLAGKVKETASGAAKEAAKTFGTDKNTKKTESLRFQKHDGHTIALDEKGEPVTKLQSGKLYVLTDNGWKSYQSLYGKSPRGVK